MAPPTRRRSTGAASLDPNDSARIDQTAISSGASASAAIGVAAYHGQYDGASARYTTASAPQARASVAASPTVMLNPRSAAISPPATKRLMTCADTSSPA